MSSELAAVKDIFDTRSHLDARRQLARDLHGQGLTIREIARRLGAKQDTVRKYVGEQQVERARARAADLASRRGAVSELLGQGLSRTEISQSLGVSKSVVRGDLAALGMPLRTRSEAARDHARNHHSRARVARLKEMMDLRNRGMDREEIANILGVSKSTVYQYEVELGLPQRRRGRPPGYRVRPRPIDPEVATRRLRVKDLHDRGLGYKTIARKLGINKWVARDDVRAVTRGNYIDVSH